jgi:FlaA1/EpsC-like NDP-sugar epimerase
MSELEAIDLIFWAAIKGKDGEIVIKKMKSTDIQRLVDMFITVLRINKRYPRKHLGVRIGEKMHEHLITEDELYRTTERDGYYIVSPYSPGEIRVNIIKKKTDLNLERFSSDDKTNFLSDSRLRKYIRNYLDETASQVQYI